MSSTNRSEARKEHKSDYYITPVSEIKLFFEEFIKTTKIQNIDKLNVVDCCAGGDVNHPMSYPEALKLFGISKIKTFDIRKDSLAENKVNYLDYKLFINPPDLIITNPPFNIALDIIKKALSDVHHNGWVIMLLRLNFFGSQQRKLFWDRFMPQYAFVHNKRMSFTENRTTDSIEYMHCCWKKEQYPEFCKIKII
jgi:hypothetical protein